MRKIKLIEKYKAPKTPVLPDIPKEEVKIIIKSNEFNRAMQTPRTPEEV